jgi:hypothetical protein
MSNRKLTKERKEIHKVCEQNELANIKANQTRARSISVGTAGGGIVEINMRGDHSNLWYQMQPTEAIELMGQLASACGVEIVMRPRQDFAAWRSWDTSLPSCVQWMGAAPWQLTDEQRAELEAAKVKHIKSAEISNETE